MRAHNIDPRRIFTTGCSAGGLFSAALAARRSNYIAAAAPNSGGWVTTVPVRTDNTPALMTIHGGPSDVVGVNFADTSADADRAFKARGGFVINCNHCGGHCGATALAPSIWEFFKAHPYGVTPNPWSALPSGISQLVPDLLIEPLSRRPLRQARTSPQGFPGSGCTVRGALLGS